MDEKKIKPEKYERLIRYRICFDICKECDGTEDKAVSCVFLIGVKNLLKSELVEAMKELNYEIKFEKEGMRIHDNRNEIVEKRGIKLLP